MQCGVILNFSAAIVLEDVNMISHFSCLLLVLVKMELSTLLLSVYLLIL